ncbi:hypothetical protein [Veillonella sp.]|uniref:hypothetical protein n=1 Tax=Veillonella sp. TaxID=1926307 RepID=UPI00257D8316|nr:hypothetical protein [Veillonella sp.]MBS6486366.1 hypothetical protein [Veillonella sp.]
MSNLKVEIGLNRCGECEKYNKGIEIHEMFNWKNCSINKAIAFDEENDEIVVFEEFLMYIIKMVNPIQTDKKIRIETMKDYYNRVK